MFKSYFGGTFEEDAVRDNFPLVYELLDEVMDFGYPQNCSADLLKTFIMQDGQAMDPAAFKVATSIAPQVTGAVSWRREGIKHVKNEVFLDVIENVNLLMSAKGTVLRSDVTGEIVMKTFLTGMPECKFGLNDKVIPEETGVDLAAALRLEELTEASGTAPVHAFVRVDAGRYLPAAEAAAYNGHNVIWDFAPIREQALKFLETDGRVLLPQ